MKIIGTSNFDNEAVADFLVCDNIRSKALGDVMINALQNTCSGSSTYWYKLVEDDYRLSRGMADIVGEPEELEAEAALAKCSKRAQQVMKRLLAGEFYGPAARKTKDPKAMKELVAAGLVVQGGRVMQIGRFYVPYGTTEFVCEKFPKHARKDPRHEDKAGV